MAGVSQGDSVSTIDGDGLVWDSVSTAFPGVSWETGATFSPEDLFFYGEVGAWYDPSDLSTMFQDSAGTTPVTADGQPVGLILDKSKGLVLGSELITNAADREFSSDTGFWTKEGSATISGGVVNINNPTGTAVIYKFNFPNEPGGYYEIAFDLVLTQGSIKVVCGGYSGTISTSGRKVLRIYRPAVNTFGIVADGAVTAIGTIDNLTIKRVAGNHASQATAASRPLYKTDGTYHWLQFDGVDDAINSTSLSVSQPTTHVYGLLIGVGKTTQGTIIDGVTTRQMIEYQRSSGTALELFAGSAEVSGGTTVTQDQQYVITGIFNGSSSKIRKNAVDSTTINPGSNSLVSAVIGKNGGGAMLHKGNIYSLIIRGALSTTQEITDTETWVNQKTGAY